MLCDRITTNHIQCKAVVSPSLQSYKMDIFSLAETPLFYPIKEKYNKIW